MQDVITLGKRLVPVEQIVFVEPFDPNSNPDFKPEKDFKARVVLLNRDTVLADFTPQEFGEAHGFRVLADDDVAVNPAIAFRLEMFAPTENFNPGKPYVTRLKWRDRDGNEYSKLLLTNPETVIAVVLRGEASRVPFARDRSVDYDRPRPSPRARLIRPARQPRRIAAGGAVFDF